MPKSVRNMPSVLLLHSLIEILLPSNQSEYNMDFLPIGLFVVLVEVSYGAKVLKFTKTSMRIRMDEIYIE